MKVMVVAKAPVPGLAKTRLARSVGDVAAADLAAAGLLDTLQTCRDVTDECVIALTGEFEQACREQEIRDALSNWTVIWQRGDGFDERLAYAHRDAGNGALLQIGMDTPHVTDHDLHHAGGLLEHHDTVLGPAEDGGWWVLGRHRGQDAGALVGVPMSTETTCEDTRRALIGTGLSVAMASRLRDIDVAADADAVATAAPHTRFAQAWASLNVRQ